MRSILVALIIFASLPFIVKRPHFGIYVYSWISYMNPHRLTWGFAYTFPFAMITGALTIFAWLISKEPKKLPITSGTIMMLSVVVWISITTIFALNPEAAIPKWIEAMKVMVITLLSIILLNDRKRIDGLVWVIVISIGYFAFKGGLFSLATGGGGRVYGPPDSRIEENNAMGLATVMVLPLVNYLRLQVQNKWLKRFLTFSIPIMFISALASQSRGAFLAIAMMTIFLWWKSKSKLLIGVAMLVVAAGALSFMPAEYFERLETIQEYEEDMSAMQRINVWILAFKFTLDNPIIGGGFEVLYMPSLWAKYSPHAEATIHNAHSVYFEVMAMHGFVGLGLFLMTCIVTYFSGNWVIARCKNIPELSWARDLSAMCQVSLLGFLTGGAFLNLAFFDLFWHIVAIPIMVRIIVRDEIPKYASRPLSPLTSPAAGADSEPAMPDTAGNPPNVQPQPAAVRKSFLRSAQRTMQVDSREQSFRKS